MNIKRYITGPVDVNTYLVWDETGEGFIVDPGGFSRKLTEDIDRNTVQVRYILLTHGHGDHIGAVKRLQTFYPTAKVVASEKEKEMLGDASINASTEMFGSPLTIDADIWVRDGQHLSVGKMDLEFRETAGHTKGGMSIVTDGAVFTGDTLFRFSIGRTDFYGGNFDTLIHSIRTKLFTLPDDTICYPGHEEMTTIGEEKRYNPLVPD